MCIRDRIYSGFSTSANIAPNQVCVYNLPPQQLLPMKPFAFDLLPLLYSKLVGACSMPSREAHILGSAPVQRPKSRGCEGTWHMLTSTRLQRPKLDSVHGRHPKSEGAHWILCPCSVSTRSVPLNRTKSPCSVPSRQCMSHSVPLQRPKQRPKSGNAC